MVAVTGDTVESDGFAEACAGPITLQSLYDDNPVSALRERVRRQAELHRTFADELYGEIPPPPEAIRVTSKPILDEPANRLQTKMAFGGRRFAVDAALWLPADLDWPAPRSVSTIQLWFTVLRSRA